MADDNKNTINPTNALMKILHGDTKDLHIPTKTVITGKKIRNSVMRRFVEEYRRLNKITDKQLIDVILSFDEVAEKETLTEDLLEQIRKDPSVLNKYKSKK